MTQLKLIQAFSCFVFVIQGLAIENSSKSSISQSTSTEHHPEVTEILEELNFIPHENTTFLPINSTNNSTLIIEAENTKKIEKKFKPSVLLNERIEPIEYQSRNVGHSSIPFNKVQTTGVQFENSVGLESDKGPIIFPNQPTVKENIKYYHTNSRYQGYSQEPINYLNGVDGGYMTVEIPPEPLKAVYYNSENNPYQVDEQIYHSNYQKPIKYDHEPVINYQQQYEYIPPDHYQHQQHHHHQHHHHDHPNIPINHDESTGIAVGKPAELLYVSSHHETSLMKTRKFPYKYYQPSHDTGIHFIEEGHAFVPRHRRISPWRKLIHLVGAFLPLGLLLAVLNKPNVVKIDRNSTQPNIMLSKWRGVDLPAEHKGIIVSDTCEDRRLCETILQGAEKDADLIYSILWNFAVKSSDEEAKKSGLEEIFNAVKKKNCKPITC